MESVLLDCLLSHRKKVPAWSPWALFCWSICFHWLWQEHLPEGVPLSTFPSIYYSECFHPSLSYLHWGKAVFSDFSRDETQLATYHRQHRCDKKLSKNSKLWTRKKCILEQLKRRGNPCKYISWSFKDLPEKEFLLSCTHWVLKLCILILLIIDVALPL